MAFYNPPQGQPQVPYPGPINYYATPVVTYQATVTKNYGQHFARKTSTALGVLQILLAIMSIAAGSMAMTYSSYFWYVGIGIWCGAFYIIAGSVAIAAGQEPTNKLIKATQVCSAIDIVFGAFEFIMACVGIASDSNSYYSDHYYSADGALAANAMMIVVGTLITIFGIWLLVVCCRAIRKGKTQTATIPVAYANTQPETVFMQAPYFQPQPFPGYYGQLQNVPVPSTQQMQYQLILHSQPLQYPSMPNSQQLQYSFIPNSQPLQYPSMPNSQQLQNPPIPNSQQLQYPSMPNSQQLQNPPIPNSQQAMNAGDQQTPPMTEKSDDPPPRY